MTERPLGDFNIPSPEMPPSDDDQHQQPVQKPPPHEQIPATGLLPVRQKRCAMLRAATKHETYETESSDEESSEDEEESGESEDEAQKSVSKSSSKVLVPDSDEDDKYSSDDAFLEAPPMKKKQRLQITNRSEESQGGKVARTRMRKMWTEIAQFDITNSSETEIRTAFINAARADFLTSGTAEPPGNHI
jgi:hypothetical protein